LVYLTLSSVAKFIWRRMTGWQVKNEVKETWKKGALS